MYYFESLLAMMSFVNAIDSARLLDWESSMTITNFDTFLFFSLTYRSFGAFNSCILIHGMLENNQVTYQLQHYR
jgi:hypothetical protein